MTVLSKHGYHRAGVAISRSRLGQDCELLREVMVSWVRQISFDGNYAVAAKRLAGCIDAGQAGEQSQLEGCILAHEEDRAELRDVLYSRQCHRLFV